MSAAIRCESITKQYGVLTAVDHVGLQVEEGELFGLLGVNGAGKTTLIRMLSTLSQPTEGTAEIFGKDILKDAYAVKQISNVSPQETAVAGNLTVKENLEFFARAYGMTSAETEKRVAELVSDFNLQNVLNQRAKTLSGGWQRRLSLAIALITSPKILYLDEPTLGLDVLARRDLWHAIEKIKGKMTIILTSHYLEEIEELCDRVAIMVSGKVVEIGTVEEIKSKTGEEKFEDAFVKIVEQEGGSLV